VYTFTPSQAARDAAAQSPGADLDSVTVVASDGQVSTSVTFSVPIAPTVTSVLTSSAALGTNPMGVAVSPTKIYVANQGSGSVSVIDRANPTAAPVTVGVVASPIAVALGPAGSNRVFVAGDNAVSVINTVTNQVVGTVSLNGGGQSYGLAVSPDGQRVYVSLIGTNQVSVINANTATDTYTLGPSLAVGANPVGIALNADGSRAYVANWGSGTVTVLNTATATPTVVSTVSVGAGAAYVAVSADGSRVYVSNYANGQVSVINTVPATPTVSTITVGAQPFGLGLSPDGSTLYVANGNDTVSVISTGSGAVVNTMTIDSAAEMQWHQVAVSADGAQVYVSDMADRVVRILTVDSVTI
jgi:YVTN family beta-propeller protein